MKKTKPQLRIEIAKDVIKWLHLEKITCNRGGYFNPHTTGYWQYKQLQKVLPKLKGCDVCAIGGMFYSYVMRHNNFDIGYSIKSIDDSLMREVMTMFSEKQMQLIESAFETDNFNDNNNTTPLVQKAIDFRKKRGLILRNGKTNVRTLVLIMKNVIRNKGTFKP